MEWLRTWAWELGCLVQIPMHLFQVMTLTMSFKSSPKASVSSSVRLD